MKYPVQGLLACCLSSMATIDVPISTWVNLSTIVLNTPCAGSVFLAVYQQRSSFLCVFPYTSVVCVCLGGYLLSIPIGFCIQ